MINCASDVMGPTLRPGDTRVLNVHAHNARWVSVQTSVCLFQDARHTGCLAILPCTANY
jgi:hypothetical protein